MNRETKTRAVVPVPLWLLPFWACWLALYWTVKGTWLLMVWTVKASVWLYVWLGHQGWRDLNRARDLHRESRARRESRQVPSQPAGPWGVDDRPGTDAASTGGEE